MQTQSHFLITAAALTPFRYRSWVDTTVAAALLLGAVLPDIPFFVLTVGGEVYYRWLASPPTTASIMEYLHFTLFYNDPWWIVAHNFFHSLLINGALLLLGLWWWRQRDSRWGKAFFWLAVSMIVHVGIDIFTHRSDGPLIWFPVNWRYRFASPISYWETDASGQTFLTFEIALNLVLLAYLSYTYWPIVRQRWPRNM